LAPSPRSEGRGEDGGAAGRRIVPGKGGGGGEKGGEGWYGEGMLAIFYLLKLKKGEERPGVCGRPAFLSAVWGKEGTADRQKKKEKKEKGKKRKEKKEKKKEKKKKKNKGEEWGRRGGGGEGVVDGSGREERRDASRP